MSAAAGVTAAAFTTTLMTDPSIIKQLVDINRTQFETWVLACAAKDLAFYRQFCGTICVAHEGMKFAAYDFEIPLDNIVYGAIKQTRELMVNAEMDELPSQLLYLTLHQLYTNPPPPDPRKGLALAPLQHELPVAIQRLARILATDVANLAKTIGLGVTHWVGKSRLQKLAATSNSSRFDPATHAELVTSIQRHAQSATEEEHVFPFGHGANTEQKHVERIPCDIAKLNVALGGGFGQGEGTLVVAPQGAGKTVLATQLAGTFALQKKIGLFITTEQAHAELEQRMFSNFGDVPFDMIKDGINKSRLPANIVDKIENTEARLGKYVHFCEWRLDKGQSVIKSMDAEITAFVRKHGSIDWLILDWLGGAIGALSTRDMQVQRLIYKQAADYVCVMAEKYNIPAIAFAQANMAQSRNKPCIDATMLTENKQLSEKFTNGFGVSALTPPYDPNDDKPGAGVYLDVQNFYMWKARKSLGQVIKVRRDFGYQRFREK